MKIKINNPQDSISGTKIPLSNQSLPLIGSHTPAQKTQDLSFKGRCSCFSFDGKIYNIEECLSIAEKHLGPSVRELFDSIKKSDYSKKLVRIEEKTISFHEKNVSRLIVDGIVYPLIRLPLDVLSGALNGLKKIKPFRNFATNCYENKLLKNARQKSKIDAKVSALKGLFTIVDKIKKHSDNEIASALFIKSLKMFNTKTGNYDTKLERSLNRIVTGMVPAVFLANDAYNLAMLCSNDKNDSEKERKIRFKQELVRVGASAYLTLITLGALQKHINSSKPAIILNTGLTVLFTEAAARLLNGKAITRLTPEQAKKINAQNGQKFEEKKEDNQAQKNNPAKDKKPLLSLGTILKASAAVIAIGWGIKGLRKYKSVDSKFEKFFEFFKKPYNNLTVDKDYKIKESKYNDVIKKLKDNGFNEIAKMYEDTAKSLDVIEQDGFLHLGENPKRIQIFTKALITPFNFAYKTVRLPYTIVEFFINMFGKKDSGEKEKAVDLLRMGIDKLISLKKLEDNDFKTFVSDNILKSFNEESISKLSNDELSNLAKTSAAAATLWFLMADNYNMAMLKSNGEDKEGAKLKFKERLIQEGSRLFYQMLLIDLFNSTFRNQYNNSLLGMSAVSTVNTFIGEILTRKSIGMPVLPHSKEDLKKIEKNKEQATGFLGSYYDFMSKLTGKNSLAERHSEAK